MKRTLAIAGALLALALSFAAGHAQPVATDGNAGRTTAPVFVPGGGWVLADSSAKKQAMTSTGGAVISDEDRDRDYVRTWRSFLSGTNLAAAAADSNAIPLLVSPYRHLKLLLKLTPRGAANTTVRVALQFRECLDGQTDSSSVFPEYLYAKVDNGTTTASVIDTTLAGHISTGSVSLPWSGEYVVRVDGARSAPGSGAAAVAFQYPNGIAFDLDNLGGRPSRFRYFQVRIRNLNITGPGVDYDLSLIGFAQ